MDLHLQFQDWLSVRNGGRPTNLDNAHANMMYRKKLEKVAKRKAVIKEYGGLIYFGVIIIATIVLVIIFN